MKFSSKGALALSVSLALMACGGGGSSGSSTSVTPAPSPSPSPSPTPSPTPTPSSYVKFADLTGDRRIPGACHQLNEAGVGNLPTKVGPTFSPQVLMFEEVPEAYSVHVIAGTAGIFGAAHLVTSTAEQIMYRNPTTNVAAEETFTIQTPGLSPPPDFLRIVEAEFNQPYPSPRTRILCVAGVATRPEDRAIFPSSISYSEYVNFGKRYLPGSGSSLASFEPIVSGSSSISYTNDRVSFEISLETASEQFGPFTGTATLEPNSTSFFTVLSAPDGRTLDASGGFFGPAGKEIGVSLSSSSGSSASEIISALVVGVAR